MSFLQSVGLKVFANMSPSALKVLILLEHCQKLTLKDIITNTHLSRNTVKKSLKELQEKKVIKRGSKIDASKFDRSGNTTSTYIYIYNNKTIILDIDITNININNYNSDINNICNYDIDIDKYTYYRDKSNDIVDRSITMRKKEYNNYRNQIDIKVKEHESLMKEIESLDDSDYKVLVKVTEDMMKEKKINLQYVTDFIFESYLVRVYKKYYK